MYRRHARRTLTAAVTAAAAMVAVPAAADALPHITTAGYGKAHWGMSMDQVQRALGRHLDCSRGMVGSPPQCVCPTPAGLPVQLVFNPDGLWAVRSTSRRASTTRRVRSGQTMRRAQARYRDATLITNGAINVSPATYLRVDGRARNSLVIVADRLNTSRIGTIVSVSDRRGLGSEFCG